MQFQRDPQVQRHIEGIVVRFEGPGRGAGGDRVQRGSFHLDKALPRQRVADRLHDFRAAQKTRQHALGVCQIEIAHPLPQLGVGQAVVFFRRRFERLGKKMEPFGEDRQLARLGALQLAVDADQIAQIKAFGQGPILLAHLSAADK